jgi:hypothetical protein
MKKELFKRRRWCKRENVMVVFSIELLLLRRKEREKKRKEKGKENLSTKERKTANSRHYTLGRTNTLILIQ